MISGSSGVPFSAAGSGFGGHSTGAHHYHQLPGSGSGGPTSITPGGAPHSHPARLPPSAHGSAMSAPHDKFEILDGNQPPVRHHAAWKKWAAILAGLLALLALALGLGLGLPCSINPNSPLCPSGGSGGNGTAPSTSPTGPCSPDDNANNVTGCTITQLALDTPWQIILIETLTLNDTETSDGDLVTPNPTSEPNVTLYDIDMFLHQNLTVVQDLRDEGMEVICYFSAGSYEPGRPDSWKFTSDDKGKELDGWPGEYWLDLNSANVRSIMTGRIEIAAKMNCSGIDPDNVDGYDNENGLGLSEEDSIDFMQFLAKEAASYGMMTGLKNAGGIIDDVLDYVQFSVNEQCVQYDECDSFTAFTNASKPVFHIEYPAGDDDTNLKSFSTSTVSKYCDIGVSAGADGFNTALKYMNLSGWIQYCDDNTFTTSGF